MKESEIKKRIAELESLVLEYQYRTGEKQRPPKTATLKEYLKGLDNKADGFAKNPFVIKEATVFRCGCKRDIIPITQRLYLELKCAGINGRETVFNFYYGFVFRNPEIEKKFTEVLNPYKDLEFIVHATPKGGIFTGYYMFVDGIIKKGKEILFKDVVKAF